MTDGRYELQPIGWVESPLVDREAAPKQGDEGSPEAWLVFDEVVREGLRDLRRAPTSSWSRGWTGHAATF